MDPVTFFVAWFECKLEAGWQLDLECFEAMTTEQKEDFEAKQTWNAWQMKHQCMFAAVKELLHLSGKTLPVKSNLISEVDVWRNEIKNWQKIPVLH